MKREDLEKLGLKDGTSVEISKEIIDAIMQLHGKGIESQKTKTDTASQRADQLQEQLDAASKQIADFKGMNVDEIKKAADDWKTKAESAATEHAQQIAKLKFDFQLKDKLQAAGAKNVAAVKALLKSDDLKLADDESIIGLDDQLAKIKESDAYLFNETSSDDDETITIVKGGNSSSVITDAQIDAFKKGAGVAADQ